MRTTFFYLILLFFIACKEQKNKQAATIKPQIKKEGIVGSWYSEDKSENKTTKLTITFTKDGHEIYDIYDNGEHNRITLIYKINGDTILSGQPPKPLGQINIYKITNDSILTLAFEDSKTEFVRVPSK